MQQIVRQRHAAERREHVDRALPVEDEQPRGRRITDCQKRDPARLRDGAEEATHRRREIRRTLQREGSMRAWLVAGVIGLALVLFLVPPFPRTPVGTPPAAFGTIEDVGSKLFTVYMLPFELTSVLLLIAIIGAVSLAKRRML